MYSEEEIEEFIAYMKWCKRCNHAAEEQYKKEQSEKK